MEKRLFARTKTGQKPWPCRSRGDDYTSIDRQNVLLLGYADFGRFLLGDFTKKIPKGFDLIFDGAGFASNDDDALQRAVRLVHDALHPGGIFIAADLYTEGNPMIPRNPAFRTFTRDGLQALFAPFETIHLTGTKALLRFDFVGRKRAA